MDDAASSENPPTGFADFMSSCRFRGPAILCLLSLLAGSCTPFARFEAKPLDVDARATRLTERRLGGRTWTLPLLTEEALKHHPEIAVARAKYDLAVAAVRSAGERPNPSATLSPQIVTPWTQWIAGTYA